jgi:integrase/recombinase XerD
MLSPAVDASLAARRAAGFQLRDHEGMLRDFARFAAAKGEAVIRTPTVLEWMRVRGGSPLRRGVRLRTVVHWARFLQAEDDRHEVPPRDAVGRPRPQRRPPFLFTPQDVTALVRGARTLGPDGWPPRLVYSTLFGLLAATGLRISEALNLRTADVTPEGLVVRRSKFGKSRLLPLHATSQHALDHYLERRGREAGACEFLFLSHQGRQLHGNTVRHIFRRLVRSLGIARPDDTPRPRLHDLRFYFANQVLTSGPDDHHGISRHMVALATYLGHRDVRTSYWYLEATPKLLTQLAERCEYFVTGGTR